MVGAVGTVGTVGTVRRSTASNSGTVVLVGAIGCVRVELSKKSHGRAANRATATKIKKKREVLISLKIAGGLLEGGLRVCVQGEMDSIVSLRAMERTRLRRPYSKKSRGRILLSESFSKIFRPYLKFSF